VTLTWDRLLVRTKCVSCLIHGDVSTICWRELITDGSIQVNKVQAQLTNKEPMNMKLKNIVVGATLVIAAFSASTAIAQSGYSNPYGAGYYQTTNPYGRGYVQDSNPYGQGYIQHSNSYGNGYVQDSNPYGSGYVQDSNPYGNGYVQDKNVFGFYGN
jgi:hypothetical protein